MNEQLVAHVMPVSVVHVFETVEVKIGHTDLLAASQCLGHGLLQAVG